MKTVEKIKGDSPENFAKDPMIFGFPGREFQNPRKILIDITPRITFFYKELFTFSTEFSTGLNRLPPSGYTGFIQFSASPVTHFFNF